MPRTSATPWGAATVVDQVTIPQRAGQKRFSSVVQLLETGGERLVRFSYATAGAARRGPVTLRPRDLDRLRSELARHPELAAALGVGAAPTGKVSSGAGNVSSGAGNVSSGAGNVSSGAGNVSSGEEGA